MEALTSMRGSLSTFKKVISVDRYVQCEKFRLKNTCSIFEKYMWSIELSEAFFMPLHFYEISLRNHIFQEVSFLLQNPNWMLEDDSCSFLRNHELYSLSNAKNQLIRKGKEISESSLVGELTLGFWTAFSYSYYELTFRKLLKQNTFFPGLQRKDRQRSYLSRKMSRVHKLRNKVFHHDPIFFDRELVEKLEDMISIISWIDPHTAELVESRSRVVDIYHRLA